MEEIYLIAAHSETPKQKDLLRKLVSSLKNSSKNILVASHVPIPSDVLEMVDYSFYNKKNELLTDSRYKGFLTLHTVDCKVASKNFFSYNSVLAIYHLFFPSLMICKNEGFRIVHYIEYDSEINDFQEFESNVSLLKEGNDAIIYNKDTNPENFFMSGEFMSLNLDSFSYDELNYNDEFLKEHISKNKMGELSTFNLMLRHKNFLLKRRDDIKGASFGLHHSDPSHFTAAFIHKGDIMIFSFNDSEEDRELLVTWNNESRIEILPSKRLTYFIIGSLESIKEVSIFINKKHLKTYYYRNHEEIITSVQDNIIEFNSDNKD